jgi:predicted PurR-regulated permease PerM
MKKAVDMHPVVILISLLGGAKVAGLVGVILAVPVAVIAGELLEDWVTKKALNRKRLII